MNRSALTRTTLSGPFPFHYKLYVMCFSVLCNTLKTPLTAPIPKRTVRVLKLTVYSRNILETTMKGFNTLFQTLDKEVRRIMDGVDRRRAIVELARMQDWRLMDLGIERGRIPEIVDGLIARRPTVRGVSRTDLPPAATAGGLPGGSIAQLPA